MDEPPFHYALTADADRLETGMAALRAAVSEHAVRHDFARMIDAAEIALAEVDLGGDRPESAILVPFHRNNFREIATLNQYVKERAAEAGLRLRGLLLPGGAGLIPFNY